MKRDKDIEDTIAAGKKNAATMQLVKNWCAHVRVEKFGGVGLIEAETGYPIGHHSLQCDFAPMGGSACWDLRDSAIDFYDRNCVSCEHRKPIALPNISELVAKRDKARAIKEAQAEEEARQARKRAEAREATRQKLKAELTTIEATILADIAALDNERSNENQNRLIESARLAPEHYGEALTLYMFDLADQEGWFVEVGIAILQSINADPKRLARLAVKAADHPLAYGKAVEILTRSPEFLESDDARRLTKRAVEYAKPDQEQFIGLPRPDPKPALLKLLWETFPKEVVAELDALLSSRRRFLVELAGRGFATLQTFDAKAANSSLRSMASTFARAYLLIDDLDRHHENLHHLNEAISGVFCDIPDEADKTIQELITGSDRVSRARAFKIYSHVLRTGRFTANKEPIPTDSEGHRTAFRRLLWAATTEDDDDVLQEVASTFRSEPYELELVAGAEIDGLLGAALLMADRLAAIDAKPKEPDENWLQVMERGNHRSTIRNLMERYVEWAAVAASDNAELTDKVLGMIDAIPDERNELKGAALGVTQHLASSVDGLKKILPHLYYGLVGPSALVRSYAATALGEVRYKSHSNIPPLVYEAFCVLLWDQYLVVHKAAVRALGRFSLPETLRPRAAHAVLNLLYYYRGREREDDFLVTCIERLATWADVFGEQKEALAKILIDAALTVEPLYLRNELRYLARALEGEETLADLVLYTLPHLGDDFNRDDETRRLLELLTDSSVVARQDKFVAFGNSILVAKTWLAYEIIERLSLAGATDAAKKLAASCAEDIPDTVRNSALRTSGQFISLAHRFESAVASGDEAELNAVKSKWHKNVAEKERQQADSNERHSRTGFSFPD
ncbi:MAG: hypothetical protein BGO57_04095 [Sphingomonadales bacterium 63-6]|nr:MAG: hypothetical protein BGO57_04095 [Sphingomonadales bacterium 63-6]